MSDIVPQGTKPLANVILPLPLAPTFTYIVPELFRGAISVGSRVIVPFGRRKFYTGIVESFPNESPGDFEVKSIAALCDAYPILRNPQLRLWEWIADYYLCSVGEVMKAALPPGLKIESETVVEINPDMDFDQADICLSERELLVWTELMEKGKLTLAELSAGAGVKNIGKVIGRLLDKGAVLISEKIVERYRPKKVQYVRVAVPPTNREELNAIFNKLKRRPRQEKIFVALLTLSEYLSSPDGPRLVTRKQLEEKSGATLPMLRSMEQDKIIEIFTREVSTFASVGQGTNILPELSTNQKVALAEIHNSSKSFDVTLLHGVTGSGKTEIYMHLADFVMRAGRQVLLLVPEIALTTQLTQRLQNVFGNKVIVYHSRFSDSKRVEIWRNMILNPKPCIIVGARSSVFLPFSKLGLVIVDEEHESSFKQFDPAPRYNGRDVAIVLANMHGAKTVLGSATPSIETYYKAKTGKYGLVELLDRYSGVKLPEIKIADVKKERQKNTVRGVLTSDARKLIRQTLDDGHQAILFQNRRGYSPLVRCKHCGYTPKCRNCDVSLTYHKRSGRLECHYCGSIYNLVKICPQCEEPSVSEIGFGTERVEDGIAECFPDTRILRMDLDTTRNKDDYVNIIDDFSAGKSDILVGTQMVTKGLDFGNVGAVVVLDADALMSYPDFRSTERAFNMMVQVSGRAGRKDFVGNVLIQALDKDNALIQRVINHDYQSYYEAELAERKKFCYPPFSRIIYIYLRDADVRTVHENAIHYADTLKKLLGNRVFGPQEPPVARVQNQYIRRIMLKVEPNVSMSKIKNLLRNVYLNLGRADSMRRTTIYYDVDPA